MQVSDAKKPFQKKNTGVPPLLKTTTIPSNSKETQLTEEEIEKIRKNKLELNTIEYVYNRQIIDGKTPTFDKKNPPPVPHFLRPFFNKDNIPHYNAGGEIKLTNYGSMLGALYKLFETLFKYYTTLPESNKSHRSQEYDYNKIQNSLKSVNKDEFKGLSTNDITIIYNQLCAGLLYRLPLTKPGGKFTKQDLEKLKIKDIKEYTKDFSNFITLFNLALFSFLKEDPFKHLSSFLYMIRFKDQEGIENWIEHVKMRYKYSFDAMFMDFNFNEDGSVSYFNPTANPAIPGTIKQLFYIAFIVGTREKNSTTKNFNQDPLYDFISKISRYYGTNFVGDEYKQTTTNFFKLHPELAIIFEVEKNDLSIQDQCFVAMAMLALICNPYDIEISRDELILLSPIGGRAATQGIFVEGVKIEKDPEIFFESIPASRRDVTISLMMRKYEEIFDLGWFYQDDKYYERVNYSEHIPEDIKNQTVHRTIKEEFSNEALTKRDWYNFKPYNPYRLATKEEKVIEYRDKSEEVSQQFKKLLTTAMQKYEEHIIKEANVNPEAYQKVKNFMYKKMLCDISYELRQYETYFRSECFGITRSNFNKKVYKDPMLQKINQFIEIGEQVAKNNKDQDFAKLIKEYKEIIYFRIIGFSQESFIQHSCEIAPEYPDEGLCGIGLFVPLATLAEKSGFFSEKVTKFEASQYVKVHEGVTYKTRGLTETTTKNFEYQRDYIQSNPAKIYKDARQRMIEDLKNPLESLKIDIKNYGINDFKGIDQLRKDLTKQFDDFYKQNLHKTKCDDDFIKTSGNYYKALSMLNLIYYCEEPELKGKRLGDNRLYNAIFKSTHNAMSLLTHGVSLAIKNHDYYISWGEKCTTEEYNKKQSKINPSNLGLGENSSKINHDNNANISNAQRLRQNRSQSGCCGKGDCSIY
jgi:hypothetical protein